MERIFDVLPELCLVGGWVRDGILRLMKEYGSLLTVQEGQCDSCRPFLSRLAVLPQEGDLDIAGPYSEEELRAVLGDARIETVNRRVGTCLVRIDGRQYEYTRYRAETYAAGGAHTPICLRVGVTREEDAERRDFTCNALYWQPATGAVYDPCGGLSDIAAGRLRAVRGDATLSSDGLRLMRLVRFAVKLGFSIEEETRAAAIRNAGNLADIAPERKLDELSKTWTEPAANVRAAELYGELGLLEYIGGVPHTEWLLLAHAERYATAAFIADCAGRDAGVAADICEKLRASRALRADAVALCLLAGRETDAWTVSECGDRYVVWLDATPNRETLLATRERLDRANSPMGRLCLGGAEIARLTGVRGAEIGNALTAIRRYLVEHEWPNEPDAVVRAARALYDVRV